MKSKNFLLVSLLVLNTYSATAQSYELLPCSSSISWKGTAAFSTYSLEGQVRAKSGSIQFEDQNLIAAELTINTKLITSDNLDLVKHLKSADFFDVKKYPEAKFTLESFEDSSSEMQGQLTIKGVSQEVTIPIELQRKQGQIICLGTCLIDRTKFGITFNSPSYFDKLKDQAIADQFELSFDLIFEKVSQ